MRKVLWQEMRRTEIEKAAKGDAVVIIPTGSVEQHGNHLPLDTDTNCCYSIAKRVAEVIDDFPVVVAPPVWWGFSPHHMKYAGTISLKFHTYFDLLTEVAVSIATHGFKKIFFLNGHGGNEGAVNTMQAQLMNEHNVPSCVGYSYWKLIDEKVKAITENDFPVSHAGETETSLQLYLRPELVDKEAVSWVSGVGGDPTKATYEKGRQLFEAAVTVVAGLIRNYYSDKLETAML